MQQAERGLQELIDSVDTMIVIPNEKLLAVAKDAGFFESFRSPTTFCARAVQGISDIITIPGIINRDFADVKTIMAGMGYAVMGTAIRARRKPRHRGGAGCHGFAAARGRSHRRRARHPDQHHRLQLAAAVRGQRGFDIIQSAAHEDANIIFGAVLDEKMSDEVKITVIATGFRDQMPERRARMLTVEDAPVVSVPVLASENWMREPVRSAGP